MDHKLSGPELTKRLESPSIINGDKSPDFIPDSQFVPDQVASADRSPDFIPEHEFQSDEEKYGSLPQQALTAAEAAGQGLIGPLAPLAERAIGVDPEKIRLRAETNPTVHALSEIAGFGAGALTGTGEAALLGKVGDVAAQAAMHGITEGAAKSALQYTGARIAAGAARVGTEMSLMQAGDEASKSILQDPNQSLGSAAVNVGLSGLIGGASGGILSGIGVGIKAGLHGDTLEEFRNRLGVRASGVNPAEAIQKELDDSYNAYHEMGSEVSGASGLKAQALEKIMPKEMTANLDRQVQSVADAGHEAFVQMVEKGVPDRLVKDFNSEFQKFIGVATDPAATVGNRFDALNSFKNELQLYSKGRWGLNAVQRTAEDYHFINITKDLAYNVKNGLEDAKVWGSDVAGLQKSLNAAWHAAIPAVKDMESKFMSKVGGELTIDPAKFNTYLNQNGRATTTTIKQQMMGKFVDAIEKFKAATDLAYEKAGVPNPRIDTPMSLGELKNSLEKTPIGHKLADAVYDKLGAVGLGNLAGAGVGQVLHPGLGGAWVGKEVLGPAFTSIFKPVMERASNSTALRAALSLGKAIIAGNQQLQKTVHSIFVSGANTAHVKYMPSEKDTDKLHAMVDDYIKNPGKMLDSSEHVSYYMPAHGMALSMATGNAVKYLASQKPYNPKLSEMDTEKQVTKAQENAYRRTLQVAENPLVALQHVANGTILPQDISVLKNIYPEYYAKMSGELVAGVVEQQQKGEVVPYRLRQSISQFVGHPLDSTMLPSSIVSAQSTFGQMQQQPQQNQPSAAKTNKLGMIAKNTMTGNQAREMRGQKV